MKINKLARKINPTTHPFGDSHREIRTQQASKKKKKEGKIFLNIKSNTCT
jgi:hypothetical protein